MQREKICHQLNKVNRRLQRIQREAGFSFVSRTTLQLETSPKDSSVVLRSVIMNPLTTIKILNEILDEQEKIFNSQLKGLLA